MKVSDAVAGWLKDRGIGYVFTVSGGANLHMIHSIAKTDGLKYICPQSEMAAGFAADAYARIHGAGCALATSGPGALNLVTAISASFYDSIPVLYLTGNQTVQRMDSMGTRQYGFQASPVVEIVKPITKFAQMVTDPEEVISVLNKAWASMGSLRPGPALVDIPDDIARAQC